LKNSRSAAAIEDETDSITFREKIIKSCSDFSENPLDNAPDYVYLNIDSAVNLRSVLTEPDKYAPNGIHIMRSHGAFVNFPDLFPAIRVDIILLLEKNTGTFEV
jgi:hypothetical protein